MKRIAWSAVILGVVVLTTTLIWAQAQGYPVQSRGVATDIKKADLDAVLSKMSASGGSGDEAVRTFNMAGTHYLSVALQRYATAKPDTKPNTTAPEHDLISE